MRLDFWGFFAALLLASAATAQTVPTPHQTCVDRAGTIDALVSANLTRSVERELQKLRALYHWDRGSHREVILEEGERRWTAGGVVAASVDGFSGFPICRSGKVESADLQSLWISVLASLEDHRREHGLRLIYFTPATNLTRRAKSGEVNETLSYARYNQALIALEAQYTRYFSVMGGWLTPRQLTVAAGVRGPDASADTESAGRPLLQVGVPAANLYTNLILTPGSRRVETVYLNLRRLPLGELPVDVSATAGYLSHEDRVFTSFGGGWILPFHEQDWSSRLEGQLTLEYGAVRWRDATLGMTFTVPSVSFPTSKTYGQLELFARTSFFNSAWLEAQSGAKRVFGGELGARAGYGGEVMMVLVEPYAALNRPETISTFSSGVGRLGWGVTLAFRFTPKTF